MRLLVSTNWEKRKPYVDFLSHASTWGHGDGSSNQLIRAVFACLLKLSLVPCDQKTALLHAGFLENLIELFIFACNDIMQLCQIE